MVQFLRLYGKITDMKKLILIPLLLSFITILQAQVSRTEVLQDLEKSQAINQDVTTTATLKVASRLFSDKNDLTSVILIIPSGSTVSVLGSDDTFLHVVFEENEGYILARHAVIDKTTVAAKPAEQQVLTAQETQPERQQQQQKVSRFTYLQNKYGTSIATRLYEGKIWKGMTAEMVTDSWGGPKKINRVINGNNIREEWIYSNTWLFIQNGRLAEWGPVR